MKRLLAMMTILSILLALPALAAAGAVDVAMEGDTYHLTLKGVGIEEGKLTVTVEGFGDTLRIGPNGWMVAAWPVAHFGDEAVRADNVNATVGGPFHFTFERDALPDEIWMDPYDEAEPEALIWENGDAVGEEAGGEIPEWLPGRWWMVKVRADCGRNGSVIHGLDISASLHLHKARGTHLTFGADGSLDTDVDVATLLEEAPRRARPTSRSRWALCAMMRTRPSPRRRPPRSPPPSRPRNQHWSRRPSPPRRPRPSIR